MSLSNYSCRLRDSGSPNTYEATIAAAYTTRIFKGAPVVATGTGKNIQNAVVASGRITSTAILGFSNEDSAPATTYPRHFPSVPAVTEPSSGLQAIIVNLATADNIHTIPLAAGETVALTLIGTTADLGVVAATDAVTVITTSPAVPLVKIVDIRSDQVGIAGGLVDVIVIRTASQADDVTF